MSDIALKTYNAVLKLQSAVGSLVLDATMTTTENGVYDVATGAGAVTSGTYPLRVMVDRYNLVDILNTSIDASDMKLIVFNTGVVPVVGATVTVRSEIFMVMSVSKEIVGDYVLIYELQCRK